MPGRTAAGVKPGVLPMAVKIVWLALCDHLPHCRPSVARLARRCQCSERTVQHAIDVLSDAGLVVPHRRSGRPTEYGIVMPTPERDAPPNEMHPRTACTPPPHAVHPTPAPRAGEAVREAAREGSPSRGTDPASLKVRARESSPAPPEAPPTTASNGVGVNPEGGAEERPVTAEEAKAWLADMRRRFGGGPRVARAARRARATHGPQDVEAQRSAILKGVDPADVEAARAEIASFTPVSDRELLEAQRAAEAEREGAAAAEAACPHERMVGGVCDTCGYDDGSEPRPSADWNAGGDP